ncbi:DNA/RNA polymerase, partial [Tricholoma matsutake]
WLCKHNSEIDWKTGKIQMTCCPKECNVYERKVKKEKREKKEKECPRKYSVMMEELEDEDMPNGEVEKPVEEWVPKAYHEYLSVFQKKESEKMLVQMPWDHGIEMKPEFVPKKSKVYSLSPKEQEEVDVLLNEQLCKGYIQPSKSPKTFPIFFVPKKDQRKRMCTDYRYLNEWTVKN